MIGVKCILGRKRLRSELTPGGGIRGRDRRAKCNCNIWDGYRAYSAGRACLDVGPGPSARAITCWAFSPGECASEMGIGGQSVTVALE